MSDRDPPPDPRPSAFVTGAFPPAPEPAGPPSLGALNTGAFPAADRVRTPDAFDVTAAHGADTVDLGPSSRPPGAPPDPDRARAATQDLPRASDPPRASRRPLDAPPSASAPRDPALVPTRPPAPPAGGGWGAILVALACLGGTVYLVRQAFPELFRRAPAVEVTVDEARPGALRVRVTPPAPAVVWRAVGADGAERAAGRAASTTGGTLLLELDDLPEGAHPLTVELRLPDGAELGRAQVTLRVDRTAPVLRLDAPAAGAQVGASSVVRLQVTDLSRVQVTCFVDERLAWRATVDPSPDGAPALLERPLGPLAPGERVVSIDAVDAGLRQTKLSRRIVVTAGEAAAPAEPAPPAPTIRLAWPQGAVVGAGPVDLAVSGATEVEALLDGASLGAPPLVLAPPAVRDGPHVLEVIARNAGGEARELRSFTFDATPPDIDVRAPARGPSPVLLEGAVRDAVDPAPRLLLGIDGGPPAAVTLPHRLDLAPGRRALALTAIDAAGNRARRDLEVEVTPAGAPPPRDVDGPTVTFVAPPGPPFVTRERRVEVAVRDPSGLGEVRLLVDGRARRPDERVEAPGGALVLRLALADLADGDHEVTVEARDAVGNLTRASRRYRLDTTPPRLALDGPAPTTITGPLDLAVRVQDAGPVPEVVVVAPGRAPVPLQGGDVRRARLDLPPGDHALVVRARDEAGNEAALPLQVRVREAAPPTAAEEDALVRIPARSGPRVRIDGRLPAGAQALVSAAGVRVLAGALPATVDLPAGRHTVVVQVTTAAGRRHEVQGAVTVDATPPSLDQVRVTALSAQAARVTGEVTDEGPVTVEVLLNGAVVARAVPCEVALRPGRNEVVVVAKDDVGNERRLTQVIDVAADPTPAPLPPGMDPLDVTDSGDPREQRALENLKAGRLQEALGFVEQVIAALREGIRSPYVLRARVRIEQARRSDPIRARALYDSAYHDLTRAIVNYGADVRSAHYQLRGDVLLQLGRTVQAGEDHARARELAERERAAPPASRGKG
ncbi:MAG: hypothetical protein M9894_26555 [Planctomycetes bacterium]|nr:hypothetical protein [Planctomycetota bacterium]